MIEIRTLKQDELEAWFDHCTHVFFDGNMAPSHRKMFEDLWLYDPQKDLQTILVATEGGRILSGVQVRKTRMYLGGEIIPMGGISCVSTLPEARRQGLSIRLLQESICLMERMQMPASLLQTGIHSHYRRLGWEVVSLFQKTLRIHGGGIEANFNVRPVTHWSSRS